ncbi:MAG: complex I subunit 4 family protein [Methylococcaceae bacterium]
MIESSFPILSLVIVFPLLTMIGLSGMRRDRHAQYFALGAAIIEVLLTGLSLLVFDFDSNRVQLIERRPWIPELNISYVVGVDGLSVAFPFLTAWVNLAIIVSTWNQIRQRVRLHLAMLFLLESVTIGIFCALDLILFLLFWELTLIPVFFLLSLYGIGPERRYAALKYTVLMLVGGASLLIGFLLLAMNYAEQLGLPLSSGLSFDYLTLLHVPIAEDIKSLVFLLLLLGFAVKAPLFPFHTWLPTLALEGPVGLTAWLTGLKLGIYGILRIAIPLVPGAAHEYDGLLKALGVTGLIYGGLIALGETNLRRMLAYSSISHIGGTLIGIATLTHQGVQGAVFQLMNFSVVSTGLFLLCGFIRHRTGTTDLSGLSGMAILMPKLTALFLILGLSNIGLPGTGGFPAELLILMGAFKSHLGMGCAVLLGGVLSVGYFFNFYRQAFLGPPPGGYSARGLDLRPRELLIAGSFVILTLVPGLMPGPFMAISNKAVAVWVSRINNPPEGSSYAETMPEAVRTGNTTTDAADTPNSPDI